jgi:PAS domain S-box-containing protein
VLSSKKEKIMDKKTLRLLILEDNPDDAELEVIELEKEGFVLNWNIVDTEQAFIKALSENPDIILADYKVPSFGGMPALQIKMEIAPDIPFIIVSGTIGEDVAVECMKAGATDYVLKDRLPRLGSVVKRALEEAEIYSKRKLAEKKLRASEKRFRILFESAKDGFFLINKKGDYVDVNPAGCKMFGYTRREFLQSDIRLILFPEDIDNAFKNNKKDVKNSGGVFPEYRMRKKDGSEIWVEINVTSFNVGGQELLLGVKRDITERKKSERALRESEEKYRLLADNTIDCIWQTDADLIFTYVNPSIFPMLGFTPQEWIGSALADHCSKEEMQKVMTIIDEELNKKKNYSAVFEIYLNHKNDRKIPVEIIGKILIDKDNNFKGFQGTTRDITERKKGREELQKKIAELETYYKATIGRESRIIELKQDINTLLERLGEKKKYNV